MAEQRDSGSFRSEPGQAGKTLVSALRGWIPGASWSQVRRLVQTRRVTVNGSLCLDEARLLAAGDEVRTWPEPLAPPTRDEDARLHHLDRWLVVAEKPPRMITLRHPAESGWNPQRKQQQRTLDEVVPRLIARSRPRSAAARLPRLYAVHRIDRDTSGLVVFARDAVTLRALKALFASHDIERAYLAVVAGKPAAQTVTTHLVRDRGDGRRGSCPSGLRGRVATTHLRPLEELGEYSLVECRLETGRTHQIRIHLAELGHPVCGDPVYRGPVGGPLLDDLSRAPRLALHATRLGFVHPGSGQTVRYTAPLPRDLDRFVARLRDG